MASKTYTSMITVIYAYVPKEKADDIVGRQMVKSEQTADTLDTTGYKKIIPLLVGSVSLYVADKAKREELVNKLKAIGA